jgi:hypothetical protein
MYLRAKISLDKERKPRWLAALDVAVKNAKRKKENNQLC